MRRGRWVFLSTLLTVFLWCPCPVAQAEEEAVAIEALSDDEVSAVRDFLTKFKGIDFGGYVETYYQYETVDPRPGGNNAITPKVFDREENSFTMNLIELYLKKDPTEPGDVGFKITLDWGEMAQRITFVPARTRQGNRASGVTHHDINADGIVDGNELFVDSLRVDDDDTTFSEGFVWWKIPLGKGIDLKVGKFATWVGYEVWQAHWNPNWSRSYIYGWGIPFTNTGIALGYPVTDSFTSTFFLVNASDTFVDITEAKTYGADFYYDIPDFSIFKDFWVDVDLLYGFEAGRQVTGPPGVNEMNSGDQDFHYIVDVSLSFSPTTWLTSATNFNIWKRERPPGAARDPDIGTGGRGKPKTWAVAQYFVFQPIERVGFALRGEYFWDLDGRALLFGAPATGAEITGTFNINIRDNLWIRPEVRLDKILHSLGPETGLNPRGGRSDLFDNEDSNLTFATAFTYEF